MLRYKESPKNVGSVSEILPKIYHNHLWLNFTEEDVQKAELIKENYPNHTGKNQAFINYLCLMIFEKYLRKYFFDDNTQINCDWIKMFQLWHFVHGGAININEKRLILIPNENIDIEGFEIQKEWVDIPDLAGDYYLPIQVDMEAKYLHIWGFVGRETLKQKAQFESIYRVYIANGNCVIDQFDSLMIALDLVNDEKGQINNLLPLEENEAKELIKTLSNTGSYSPRLEVKFEKWASLLNEENRLEELALSMNKKPLIKLRDWLTGIVTEGWEKLEELTANRNPQLALRNTPVMRGEKDTEEIEKLVEEMETTEDEYKRWIAAENLRKLDPNHHKLPEVRIKNLVLKEHEIALKVSIMRKLDGVLSVFLRVNPQTQIDQLPDDLCLYLQIFDQEGKQIIKDVKTLKKPEKNYIQRLGKFNPGDRFNVKISVGDVAIREEFVF